MSFRHLYRKVLLSVCSVALMVPVQVRAADPMNIVDTSARAVSKAQFLEWTLRTYDIQTKNKKCVLKMQGRIAERHKSMLCAAQEKNLLGSFAANANITRSIEAGEALQILTTLTGKKNEANVTAFIDVPKSGALTTAVKNAIANRWLLSKSATEFGVKRPLTGAEVLSLLQSATGKLRQQQTPDNIRINLTPKPTGNGLSTDLLQSVWDLIQRDYLYSDKIDSKEAQYKSIEGLVQSLGDPYSTFFRPSGASQFQTQIKGEVTGIGAHVEMQNNILTIVAPLPKSPAEKAGLKAGDQILEADGNVLAGLDLDKAVGFIRGQAGTSVALKIRRGTTEFMVTVSRAVVTIPEVEITWDGTVAIVKLVQFGDTTNSRIRELFTDIANDGARGIVLDLRNNPGGLLQAAGRVISNFVPSGSTVVQVKGRSDSSTEVTDGEPTVADSVKVIVLVNGGSASASEIVAGALQDYKRATIVGAKTFGKGTVQEILSFASGEALKLTVAEWLTPNGRVINKIGVTPDVVFTEQDPDAQLARAIRLAR